MAGLLSFPAASAQSVPETQTGIHTRNAILWRIYSSSSKIIVVSPPDMRRKPAIFMRLSPLRVSLFGYFDSFKTDSNAAYVRMKELLKKAGLPSIRFHDLRHSFASIANAKGIPMYDIGKALGHTHRLPQARFIRTCSTQTTKDYWRKCGKRREND